MSEEVPLVWHRRKGWRRTRRAVIASFALLGLAIFILWLMRRSLAEDAIEKYLERNDVQATYTLERVGLRTQRVRDLVLGDPDRPDLTADFIEIKTQVEITGKVSVYRVTGRGLRLRGRLTDNGQIELGDLDKLIPEGDGGPFQLPDLAVDLADAQAYFATPYGPVGLAVVGKGHLRGGFQGMAAASASAFDAGTCRADGLKARLAIAISAEKPSFKGPIRAASLSCGDNFALAAPLIQADLTVGNEYDSATGQALVEAASMRLADGQGAGNLRAKATFDGPFDKMRGDLDAVLDDADIAGLTAREMRLDGNYRLDAKAMDYRLESALTLSGGSLAEGSAQGVADNLSALVGTPLEPVGRKLARAIVANARAFEGTADLIVDDQTGIRLRSAELNADAGGRVTVAGGSGVIIPIGGGDIGFDTGIEISGGDLPSVRISVNDPPDARLTGTAEIAPYRAGGALVSFGNVRFAELPGSWYQFEGDARLTGPIPGGYVEDLRVPLDGRFGPDGQLYFAEGCRHARFRKLATGSLVLADSNVQLCGEGGAIYSSDGGLRLRTGPLDLNGTLGDNPFALKATSGRLNDREGFRLADVDVMMGDSATPILLTAEEVRGAVAGGLAGTMAGGTALIGNVAVGVENIDGSWQFDDGRLAVQGSLTAYDRADPVKFYPLDSDNVSFVMADGRIEATGTLYHPPSGISIMDVRVTHNLDSGHGDALLDVSRGIRFNENLQPEELTPITEGVIALVNGSIAGQGHIGWGGDETVSDGTFTITDTDLAATFGPITGLNGTIHFTDLLGLKTDPGQVATVESINPGILVENGVLRYQLLGDQLVKIEQGEWPFMDGKLFLRETVLDFGRPSAKRLTFAVEGFNAETFVTRLEFDETLYITGIFDGVLPMIFDEEGGRIVGGRLDAREGGGILEYKAGSEDLSFGAKIALSIVRSLRYGSMVVRLDGDLAGEFATRLDVGEVALGETTAAKFVKKVSDIPVHLNVNITGPFRAIIATFQSFGDPQTLISDVLPGRLDEIPGAEIEVIRTDDKRETETDTMPTEEEVK